jgi:hypothetical protein
MANGEKVKLSYILEFATEQEKKDFEVAFQGWLKQYQQIATIQNYVFATAEEGISFYLNALPGI